MRMQPVDGLSIGRFFELSQLRHVDELCTASVAATAARAYRDLASSPQAKLPLSRCVCTCLMCRATRHFLNQHSLLRAEEVSFASSQVNTHAFKNTTLMCIPW